LEFFESLFPPKKVARLIRQLKALQDNLGEFNDLSVQQAYLLRIAEELPVSDTRSKRALVATGYLVETLARRQQVVKASFAKTFTDFTSPGNQKLYRQLFATTEKRSTS
jgi:CHAD domain-containing protein